MNSEPVKKMSNTEKTREEKRVPPPGEFEHQLKVAEVDPDQQSKWKKLQQNVDAPNEAALPPPMFENQFEGSSLSTPQPESQVQSTSVTASTSSETPQGNTYSNQQPMQMNTTQDLPTSPEFWDSEKNTQPPQQTTTESSQTTTSDDDQTSETETPTKKLMEQQAPIKEKKDTAYKETGKSLKGSASKEFFEKTATPTQLEKKAPLKKETKTEKYEPAVPPKDIKKKEKLPDFPKTAPIAETKTRASKKPKATEKKGKAAPISHEQKKKVKDIESSDKDLGSMDLPFKAKEKKQIITDDTSSKPIAISSFTPQIATAAAAQTESVAAYLDPKVRSIFTNMVSVIKQEIKPGEKGIITTKVILKTPSLKSSSFYGTKITLKQFPTAPNSFNVVLTGNAKAVTLFNNNLESLHTAFHKGNFDFTIGNLRANYTEEDRPLFKRKGPVGDDKGNDSGNQGQQR